MATSDTQREKIIRYLLSTREWVSRPQLVAEFGHRHNYAEIIGAARPRRDETGTLKQQGLAEVKFAHPNVYYRLTKRGRTAFSSRGIDATSARSAKRPSSIPWSGALQFVLHIKWEFSRESLELDLGQLVVGTVLRTYDIDSSSGKETVYEAACTGIKKMSTGYTLLLEYARERNLHLIGRKWLFGVSEVRLTWENDTEQWNASANWTSKSDPWSNGQADTCRVIPGALIEEVTRGWVERIVRKRQQQFRSELVTSGAVCCISSDTVFEALDAAHVVDAADGGVATSRNGLLMRADLHRLFDADLLRISDEGVIDVDAALRKTSYWAYNDRRLEPAVLRRVKSALAERARRRGRGVL